MRVGGCPPRVHRGGGERQRAAAHMHDMARVHRPCRAYLSGGIYKRGFGGGSPRKFLGNFRAPAQVLVVKNETETQLRMVG